jgi:hypothetical protein
MKLSGLKVLLLVGASIGSARPCLADESDVASLKRQILDLARSYQGEGDPDFSRQASLDVLVSKLVEAAPRSSVADRISLIQGAWKQEWGAYDYRNDDRGVDPELGTQEIYQVVFPGGYYYNASYLYRDGDRRKERIGLLRGEYSFDPEHDDRLRVRFTNYPGLRARVEGKELWELPALAESGQLEDTISIVPTWIVRLFFGRGSLREVYTDHDLRLTYGSDKKNFDREILYVMSRVSQDGAGL